MHTQGSAIPPQILRVINSYIKKTTQTTTKKLFYSVLIKAVAKNCCKFSSKCHKMPTQKRALKPKGHDYNVPQNIWPSSLDVATFASNMPKAQTEIKNSGFLGIVCKYLTSNYIDLKFLLCHFFLQVGVYACGFDS